MTFNDLKVGMVIGEILFKYDPEMHTNYTIKIINSIKNDIADITTYVYSKDGGKYHLFKGRLPNFGGLKDFGLSSPIEEFEMDDKINFVRAIFES